MAGVNKVILLGNLGRDPEMRNTREGKPVCSFTMATSEKWKGAEHTEWHKLVAFGKQAELCRDYLHKGSQVYIEGRLQTRSWMKDDQQMYSTEVVVNNICFIGKSDGPQRDGGKPGPADTAREKDETPLEDIF